LRGFRRGGHRSDSPGIGVMGQSSLAIDLHITKFLFTNIIE
jgi:hypothetical protein